MRNTSWHSQISSVFKLEGKKELYIAVADRWMPEYMDFTGNTAFADYVWLPIRFDGEMAYLDWKDEWRLEDYETDL